MTYLEVKSYTNGPGRFRSKELLVYDVFRGQTLYQWSWTVYIKGISGILRIYRSNLIPIVFGGVDQRNFWYITYL
jgi:hypothetical protein